MNLFKKIFGNNQSPVIKNFSEIIFIMAGPVPESEKIEFVNDLRKKHPETDTFLCSSTSNLQKELSAYNNSTSVEAVLYFSLISHPNGEDGLMSWFQKFVNEIEKMQFRQSPTDATIISDGNGDGFLKCTCNLLNL
ncbi:MAG: hypothetical protein WCJ03_09305 [Bacteroidales bacterium]